MQEIATVSKGAASLHGHVPSHLPHPLLVRVNGDPGDVHLAALKMDEKQDHDSVSRLVADRPMWFATALDKAFENIDCMSAILRCRPRITFMNQLNALSNRVEYYAVL